MALVQFLVFSILLHGALGEFVCEQLPVELCSYSVSSSGKRCLLETNVSSGRYQCKTSEVVTDNTSEWIETDDCVRSCGIDRNSVGISSDSLLDPFFTTQLCSPDCYQNCPNVIDLYHNLALGEGTTLPHICRAQQMDPRHAMTQVSSSGATSASGAAAGPVSASSPLSSELPSSFASPPTSI